MKIILGSDPVDMNCQDMYSLSLLNKPYCHKPDRWNWGFDLAKDSWPSQRLVYVVIGYTFAALLRNLGDSSSA